MKTFTRLCNVSAIGCAFAIASQYTGLEAAGLYAATILALLNAIRADRRS